MRLLQILHKIWQHNWIAIIYFNFKMLPLKYAIRFPFDFYHGVRFENLSGEIVIDSDVIYRGMIKIGSQGSDMFQHNGCVISVEGKMLFHGSCVFGCSNIIKIRKSGNIEFGNNCILGANNLIYVEGNVQIGNDFLSSWNCQFLDSDTHTLKDVHTGKNIQIVKGIRIGNHCWIGNYVKINKGTFLLDDTIVASNSLVNKDFSQKSTHCVLAGIPAKIVKENIGWSI